MRTFLPAMCAAFFMRVKPASRNANPACMNMTRTAASTTQTVLTAITRSAVFMRPRAHRGTDPSEGLSLLRACPC